jgi:hypothetical protein
MKEDPEGPQRKFAALFFMFKNRRTGILLWAAFLGLILLYFWEALTQSELMVDRDLPIFFFPNLKLWVEAVQAGQWPLWNPYSFAGQPLFASLQTGILYPPNILLLLFPMGLAFNGTIALHFFLSGWFIYLLTRELGGSRTAGVLATLTFTLGGFLISIHNVLNTLQSATWTPLIFFFFLRAIRERTWKYPLWLALATLVQFLGAGIEVFLITQGMLLFLAFCPQALLAKRDYLPWKWRFGLLGVMTVLFLGLGAIQILPFWEMVQHSVRQLGFAFEEATRWSLDWSNLLYVILPDFFWRGHEFYKTDQNYLKSIYLGVIPFIMVFFFFREPDRRKGWFGLILFVFLLLALGKNTPFYRFIYEAVPGIRTIRYPVKFFFLANLFICLSTGLGWDALVRRSGKDPTQKLAALKKISLILAFFFILLLLILTLFRGPVTTFLDHAWPISPDRPWRLNLHNIDRFSFFAVLNFLCFAFLADRKLSFQKGRLVIVALLVLDLFLANWGFYRKVDQKAFYSLSPNLQTVLADPEKGRIYPDPLMVKTKVARRLDMEDLVRVILKECFYFDYPLVHRVYNTWGFGIMTYQPYQDLLDLLSEKGRRPGSTDILRLMNARFVLWHEALPDPAFTLIRTGESYVLLEEGEKSPVSRPPKLKTLVAHLYENRAVLPRAFLISKYLVVPNRLERMKLIRGKGFDPTQTVLLEEPPDPPRRSQDPVPDGDRVQVIARSLNRIDCTADCPAPRILFLSETYYPGWKVWVDGKQEKIYRADHAFRAVALGPGRHTITFKYQPFSFYLGAVISLLTLIALLAFLIFFKKNFFGPTNSEESPCPPVT